MRILIVDDHPLFCEGLKLLLTSLGHAQSVSTCTSSKQLEALRKGQDWDLVLLDWNLGRMGLSARQLLEQLTSDPQVTRVVVVSAEVSPERVREAIDAGAVGFVPKEASSDLLIDAIQVTSRGGIYLPAGVFGSSAQALAHRSQPDRPFDSLGSLQSAFPKLTKRQLEVLVSVVRGQSNKRVARELDISENTVKQHLYSVFRELGVSSRTEAIYLLAKREIKVF